MKCGLMGRIVKRDNLPDLYKSKANNLNVLMWFQGHYPATSNIDAIDKSAGYLNMTENCICKGKAL